MELKVAVVPAKVREFTVCHAVSPSRTPFGLESSKSFFSKEREGSSQSVKLRKRERVRKKDRERSFGIQQFD